MRAANGMMSIIFMEIVYAALLGAVQGLSEFLPISSSAHLLILHRWLQFEASSELTFDVALHIGTVLAMLVYFAKDIIQYLRTNPKFLGYLLLGSIPAALVGVLADDWIEANVRSLPVVAVMLVLVSGLFFYVEKYGKKIKPIGQAGWRDILLIGAAQVIALIPGSSRSGITTSAAMQLGYTRVAATRLSFLLALPITAGAAAKKMFDLFQGPPVPSHDMVLMAIGIVTSFAVGLATISWLLNFFKRYSLRTFAWYRMALAIVVFSSWLVYYR